jgi:hypothetical protein
MMRLLGGMLVSLAVGLLAKLLTDKLRRAPVKTTTLVNPVTSVPTTTLVIPVKSKALVTPTPTPWTTTATAPVKIASLYFDSLYFYHSDSDCDCDSEGDIEDNYRKMLDTFLDQNPHLKKVACIAIQTSYTHRIINQTDLEFSVCFTDKCWAPQLAPTIHNMETYNIIKDVIDDGVVVFDDYDVDNVFNRIDLLGSGQYCSFCKISNLYEMIWYKVGDNILVLCTVDTVV